MLVNGKHAPDAQHLKKNIMVGIYLNIYLVVQS